MRDEKTASVLWGGMVVVMFSMAAGCVWLCLRLPKLEVTVVILAVLAFMAGWGVVYEACRRLMYPRAAVTEDAEEKNEMCCIDLLVPAEIAERLVPGAQGILYQNGYECLSFTGKAGSHIPEQEPYHAA